MARKPNANPGSPPELTPLELTVMQIIWEKGDATAAEVGEVLEQEQKRPLADTTIHTVLANLRKKEYVEPIPTVERALRFAPCVPREQVAGRRARRLLHDFFDGSVRRMMAHLLKEEKMDEAELAQIKELLEKGSKEGGEEQ